MPQSINPLFSELSDPRLAKLKHLRQISDLWDRAIAIPGTNLRVGMESLIGLLPVGGDFVGIILSSYILLQAVQLGLPKTILVRMFFNIALDGVVGSIPIVGDLFDTSWKANTKNVNLLEAHLSSLETSRRADRSFLFFLFSGLVVVAVVLLAVTILIVRLLIRAANLYH